jgi:hypothetical protein
MDTLLDERLSELERIVIQLRNDIKCLQFNLAEIKMDYVETMDLAELEEFLADQEEDQEDQERFLTLIRGGKLDS